MTDDASGFCQVSDRINAVVESVRSAYIAAPNRQLLWEALRDDESIGRAVVQFSVDATVFEVLFNSESGYRGLYRSGAWIGACANSLIIESLKTLLTDNLSNPISAWHLKWGPAVTGRVSIDQPTFIKSLDPNLSKLWYSTAIVSDDGALRTISSGVSDRLIDASREYPWKAIEQDPSDCFLEMKGAFAGPFGLFQLKSPAVRSFDLASKGEA